MVPGSSWVEGSRLVRRKKEGCWYLADVLEIWPDGLRISGVLLFFWLVVFMDLEGFVCTIYDRFFITIHCDLLQT